MMNTTLLDTTLRLEGSIRVDGLSLAGYTIEPVSGLGIRRLTSAEAMQFSAGVQRRPSFAPLVQAFWLLALTVENAQLRRAGRLRNLAVLDAERRARGEAEFSLSSDPTTRTTPLIADAQRRARAAAGSLGTGGSVEDMLIRDAEARRAGVVMEASAGGASSPPEHIRDRQNRKFLRWLLNARKTLEAWTPTVIDTGGPPVTDSDLVDAQRKAVQAGADWRFVGDFPLYAPRGLMEQDAERRVIESALAGASEDEA